MEHFTVFRRNGSTYLREQRPYEGRYRQVATLDPIHRGRVDALAKLLQQPKEIMFRIPRCIGWRYLEIHKAISFVFEIPVSQLLKPTSLLELLSSNSEKPSLESKFHLAYRLTNCLAQLHMVKWVNFGARLGRPPSLIEDSYMKAFAAKTFFSFHRIISAMLLCSKQQW